MPDKLSKVLNGGLCAGCGGCAAVAPSAVSMRMTKDGFLRPHFTRRLQHSEQRRITQICPSVGQECEAGGRVNDPNWGPYVSASLGFSVDPVLRRRAASGGALSGYLIALLKGGHVDGIIQIKADPNDPMANITTISTTTDDILEASGSRYAPSSPLDSLNQLRGDGRRYAFVGKPCDVSALARLRQIDPEVRSMVPVLVSFMCAGVPSLDAGASLLRLMGVEALDVATFRHRADGWPGRATARLQSGKTVSLSYSQSWGDVLSKAVQHRCKICADGSGVFADIIFADAWEADSDGYPDFEDRPGQSLILARTALGQSLLLAAQGAGHLEVSTYDLNDLEQVQPGQVRRRRVLLARLAALWIMGRPIPHYRGMGLWAMSRSAPATEVIRNFAGMIRRTVRFSIKGDKPC
ncbi:Coenzyme F420 hydrogenase/dehydrogenase, beta subunit C-terminal domain [Litoreibacter albidus]|uniref:Coenzyme F420 hydrogenase/dehydrogenase, beta subunit C-terminal domain n=1 Tax=Litoreibacter albidus TaxID=670155 RepID=UPI003734DDCC